MKTRISSELAFLNLRVALAVAVCALAGVLLVLAFGMSWGVSALAQKPGKGPDAVGRANAVPMVGPVSQDQDLRALPYIAPKMESEARRLLRHPPSLIQNHGK